MFTKNKFLILSLLILMSGCVINSSSSDTYTRGQTGQRQVVEMGTVKNVRNVEIEGTKSGIGAGIGGVAGGVAGSTIGHGGGKKLGTVGGAILGAVLGHATEDALTKEMGLEITVEMDDGETVAIVQAGDVDFKAGDRVRMVTAMDGTTRVTH